MDAFEDDPVSVCTTEEAGLDHGTAGEPEVISPPGATGTAQRNGTAAENHESNAGQRRMPRSFMDRLEAALRKPFDQLFSASETDKVTNPTSEQGPSSDAGGPSTQNGGPPTQNPPPGEGAPAPSMPSIPASTLPGMPPPFIAAVNGQPPPQAAEAMRRPFNPMLLAQPAPQQPAPQHPAPQQPAPQQPAPQQTSPQQGQSKSLSSLQTERTGLGHRLNSLGQSIHEIRLQLNRVQADLKNPSAAPQAVETEKELHREIQIRQQLTRDLQEELKRVKEEIKNKQNGSRTNNISSTNNNNSSTAVVRPAPSSWSAQWNARLSSMARAVPPPREYGQQPSYRQKEAEEAVRTVLEGLQTAPTGQELEPPEGLLNVRLLKHQRQALAWMIAREVSGRIPIGGILADEQGLGKTVMTMSLIVTLPRDHNVISDNNRSPASSGEDSAGGSRTAKRLRTTAPEEIDLLSSSDDEEERRNSSVAMRPGLPQEGTPAVSMPVPTPQAMSSPRASVTDPVSVRQTPNSAARSASYALAPGSETSNSDEERRSRPDGHILREQPSSAFAMQRTSATSDEEELCVALSESDGEESNVENSENHQSTGENPGGQRIPSDDDPGLGVRQAFQESLGQNLPVTIKKEEAIDVDEDDEILLEAEEQVSQSLRQNGTPVPNRRSSDNAAATPTSGVHNRGGEGGTLIVCPLSVLPQWAMEIREKTTRRANVSVHIYHGPGKKIPLEELASYTVVLTTFGSMASECPIENRPEAHDPGKKKRKVPQRAPGDLGLLFRLVWHRVVLDEGHLIRNHRTLNAHAAEALKARRRWILSGTPIQNSIDDLFSYFWFLRYEPYHQFAQFNRFVKGVKCRNYGSSFYEFDPKVVQAILRPMMLRRTKKTQIDGRPIVELPDKVQHHFKLKFTPPEQRFYNGLAESAREKAEKFEEEGVFSRNIMKLLVQLLRLRQTCDSVELTKQSLKEFEPTEAEIRAAIRLGPAKRKEFLNLVIGGPVGCGLCNDVAEGAVVSSCGHTFCRQCLGSRLQDAIKAEGEEPVGFECPQCGAKLQGGDMHVAGALVEAENREGGDDPLAVRTDQDGIGIEEPDVLQYILRKEAASSIYSTKIQAVMRYLMKILRPASMAGTTLEEAVGPGHLDSADVPDTRMDGIVKPEAPTNPGLSRGDVKREPGISLRSLEGPSSGPSALPSAPIKPDPSTRLVKGEISLDLVEPSASISFFDDEPLTGNKVIIFSQWTGMLSLMEVSLDRAGFKCCRLDGTMSLKERAGTIEQFKGDPAVEIILVSLKAASLGLNLVAANYVVLLDLWWNPAVDEQAIDRAHRIGQTRVVHVARFTIKDTIEDRILELQKKKKDIAEAAYGDSAAMQRAQRLTADDIRFLFQGL